MTDEHDRLAMTLDRVADTADKAAGEQRQAAEMARDTAHGRRNNGIDDTGTTQSVRRVLELLGRSTEHLTAAAAGLRRAWAAALAEDGLSIRQIGERLGVTHQRVSALLTRHRHADTPQSRR